MPDSFGSRLKHAWNVFQNRDPTSDYNYGAGPGYGVRPDRVRLRIGNERSIVASVYNRIAMDVAATTIHHVRLDENDQFLEVLDTGLDRCFSREANIDQTGRAFVMDVVLSMFDEGSIAIVPVDTTLNPLITGSYDIQTMRTARIVQWYPEKVRVELYDDRTSLKKEITLPKSMVAIIENPFYSVMNEPNSTLRRLIYKLNLLDAVDEQSGSGKLDLILQFPFIIKSESRREQAERRRKEIETQLSGSKYGIAYTDGTEKVTQLNRSIENNLMSQIEYLTSMLYSQLGLTQKIFDGTADVDEVANYFSRSIEPIVATIVDECNRKFLTRTARSQRQTLFYTKDPFKFIPVSKIADIADKFTRNEIVSPNEFRQTIGMKPSKDPKANELRNRNIAASKVVDGNEPVKKEVPIDQNGGLNLNEEKV